MLASSDGKVSDRFDGSRRTVLFRRGDATQWVFVLGNVDPKPRRSG